MKLTSTQRRISLLATSELKEEIKRKPNKENVLFMKDELKRRIGDDEYQSFSCTEYYFGPN